MKNRPLPTRPDPRQVIRGYFVTSSPPKTAENRHFYGILLVQKRKPKIDFIGLSRDWLDVRLPAQWEPARDWFVEAVGGATESFVPPAARGYRQGVKAVQPQSTSQLSLMGDNPAALGWSMFSASGGASEWGWNEVITRYEVAQANRVDVALDFKCSQRTFDRLFARAAEICIACGRQPHQEGYPGPSGVSLYLNRNTKTGVNKGETIAMPQYTGILYEKGKMLGVDPDWRRFEVRNRPDKPRAKERALMLEPNEILGSPDWSRALLNEMGYSDAVKPGRVSPFAQEVPVNVDAKVARRMSTLSHMGEQYGEAVRELVQLIGEDEARRMVEQALFRPVIVQDDGREISGPALLRREAQKRWNDVFRDDLQQRIYDAGDSALLH